MPVYELRLPPRWDRIEFTEEERQAIVVSRAATMAELFQRFGAKLPLLHHEEDVGIIVQALEQYVETFLKAAERKQPPEVVKAAPTHPQEHP